MVTGFERAFVFKWLGDPPKHVLDVGCGKKWKLFRKEGFESWAVDILPCSDDPHFRREDARHMSFPDEFFDVVYSISAIEHVGLDRYGDEVDIESGDRKAVLEMGRVLKSDGIMVITLPFGEPIDWVGKHRLYDDGRLEKLFSGFNIVEREYWMRGWPPRGGKWHRSNSDEVISYMKGIRKWVANVNVAVKKCQA